MGMLDRTPCGIEMVKVGADCLLIAFKAFRRGVHGSAHAEQEPFVRHQADIMQQVAAVIGHVLRPPALRLQFLVCHWPGDDDRGHDRQDLASEGWRGRL